MLHAGVNSRCGALAPEVRRSGSNVVPPTRCPGRRAREGAALTVDGEVVQIAVRPEVAVRGSPGPKGCRQVRFEFTLSRNPVDRCGDSETYARRTGGPETLEVLVSVTSAPFCRCRTGRRSHQLGRESFQLRLSVSGNGC